MTNKVLNVLEIFVEKRSKTNKWFIEKSTKDRTIVFSWYLNEKQTPIKTMLIITELLKIGIMDLDY